MRTCYIHFLLSFLVESNPGVIKEYFDRKTRLGTVTVQYLPTYRYLTSDVEIQVDRYGTVHLKFGSGDEFLLG